MMIPESRYIQHVDHCADLYQKTYGTRSVEQMIVRRNEYRAAVENLAKRSEKEVKQVIQDVSVAWTEKRQKANEKHKKINR